VLPGYAGVIVRDGYIGYEPLTHDATAERGGVPCYVTAVLFQSPRTALASYADGCEAL
jgi:hypothetical protein